ncbi:DUF5753 domain-containing protein [Nocardia tengchongensis]|uniref:DUF5753 domain-containing protein n=1 Tax=Nocardia tengchongensis TaxID=2055889 RepID=UPI0036BC222D
MTDTSPTVANWELMLRIRSRATEHGLKTSTIVRALDVSQQYWSALSRGRGTLAEDKLKDLIGLLEFDTDEQAELLALRDIAKRRHPFAEFSSLFNEQLMRYYGLESGAKAIRSFENSVVSGLLQTPDYVRALMKSRGTTNRPTEAEQRVRARHRRQQWLDGPDGLRLSVVMGQAALMYQVGGPDIQRAQLRHLQTVADQYPETLSIRVVPFEQGTVLASLNASTFHLLSFESPRLPVIGWLEYGVIGEIIEDKQRLEAMEYLFEQEDQIALDRQESLHLIDQIANQLS